MQIPFFKQCSKCKETKLIINFQPHKNYADGYTSWCKQCVNDARKQWAIDHKDYLKDRSHQRYLDNKPEINERNNARCRERWHTDPEYRDRKNKQKRDKYANNESFREKTIKRLEQFHEQTKHDPRILQKKRDNVRVYRFKRRTNPISDEHPLTKQEWLDLCKKYDYHCVCCGEKKPLEVDHVKPVSKGGGHSLSNCQPLCRSCNVKKMQNTIDYRKNWEGG